MDSAGGARGAGLAAAISWIAGLVFALRVAPVPLDDAFITHRYAANLLTGRGLTFEPAAAAAEGFSSPLWLGIDLAVGRVLGLGVIPGAAALVGCASLLLALAALAATSLRHGRLAPWLACPLLALSAPVAYHTATGLETLLFTALSLATVAALVGGLPRWVGVGAAALAVACRPEGLWLPVVLGATLAALGWSRGRARALPLGVSVAVAGGILFVVRRALFGQWLPNTYAAKPPDRLEGARYLVDGLLDPWALGLLLLAGLGAWFGGRRSRAWLAAAVAWAAAAVLEGGDWMPGARFLLPMYAALAAAAAGGAVHLATRRGMVLMVPVTVTLVAGVLAAEGMVALAADTRRTIRHEDRVIEELLSDVDARGVALVDIGRIGFFGRMEIVDLGGLTDPVIGRAPGGRLAKRFDRDYLFDRRRPEAIVLRVDRDPALAEDCAGAVEAADLRSEVERWIHADPRLATDYRLHRAFLPVYDRVPLYGRLVYLRRGLTNSDGPCRQSISPAPR